jgi:hypothetical protein
MFYCNLFWGYNIKAMCLLAKNGNAVPRSRITSPRYDVGYKRPPPTTRFQPGQSGNPQGRPRRTTVSLARKALERRITESGAKPRAKKTVRQTAYRQLADKAAGGDLKALAFLLGLEHQEDDRSYVSSDAHTSPDEALEIVKAFVQRQQQQVERKEDAEPQAKQQ